MAEPHTEHTKPGVCVLVMNGDRLLLEKRRHLHGSSTWGPPGGYIHSGETFEQAAIRATREEIGVTISDAKFRVITNDIFEEEHKQFVMVWMEAKYVSGEPTLDIPDEETQIGWFQWGSLPQPLLLSLVNLLYGNTYQHQTTDEKSGSAIETRDMLPEAEAFQSLEEGETMKAQPMQSEPMQGGVMSKSELTPEYLPDKWA
jgi:8-oxo-dGTP diphosphatase